MIINFYKFHGAGNDFIFIDNQLGQFGLNSKQLEMLCHRKRGIGADGVVFFNSSLISDFEMKYYNADGSEGSMCGNAGRCAIAFADTIGISKERYLFSAIDGLHTAKFHKKNGCMWQVELGMIDVNRVEVNQGSCFIDTGSPHHIEFVKDLEHLDVIKEGIGIRYSSRYEPDGVNVNFVEVVEGVIKVRTYERGVENETLSCGTGVVASAMAMSALEGGVQECYKVQARGGKLEVSFQKEAFKFKNVVLSGPAVMVYSGVIEI